MSSPNGYMLIMPPENYSTLAPVLIITYNRYDHLRQTVEALKQNYLADQTILFIASDYPKSELDRESVQKVREYIKSICGFKSVIPIFREYNYGAIENALSAIKKVFGEYDRLIIMEDDIVTGKGFLKFINDGLEKYKDNKEIYAICGYLWALQNAKPVENQIFLHAFAAWGCGIWKAKEAWIQGGPDLAREFLSSSKLFCKMNRASPHYLLMVASIAKGHLVAGDVDRCLTMIKCQKLCLFPPKSLVRNIGFDGSGIHCGLDSRYASQPINQEVVDITASVPVMELEVNRDALYNYFGGNAELLKNIFIYCMQRILPPFILNKLWSLLKPFADRRSNKFGERSQ